MPNTASFLDADPILTGAHEIGAYLKIPPSTTYALLQNKIVPATRIGKMWKTRKSVLDAWFAKRIGKVQ